jgi:hypothetical protein
MMENILFFSIVILIDYNWYILHYRLRYESDHIINMRHEKETLDTVCEQEEKQLKKLQKVMEIVDTYVLHLFVGDRTTYVLLFWIVRDRTSLFISEKLLTS